MSIAGLLIGLVFGYNFIIGLLPAPVENEGTWLLVFIWTGLIGVVGCSFGFYVGKEITEH